VASKFQLGHHVNRCRCRLFDCHLSLYEDGDCHERATTRIAAVNAIVNKVPAQRRIERRNSDLTAETSRGIAQKSVYINPRNETSAQSQATILCFGFNQTNPPHFVYEFVVTLVNGNE